VLIRLLVLGLSGLPMGAVYLAINQREGVDHRVVEMPEWVSFSPILALPYFLMLGVSTPLQLLMREDRRFYRAIVAVFFAFAVTCLLWIFYPTKMLRPDFEPSAVQWFYSQLVIIDRPVNILPCGHVLWPVIGIYFLGQEKPKWLWWMILLHLFGMWSVWATWQHRPIDVLIGTVIALTAARVADGRAWTRVRSVLDSPQ